MGRSKAAIQRCFNIIWGIGDGENGFRECNDNDKIVGSSILNTRWKYTKRNNIIDNKPLLFQLPSPPSFLPSSHPSFPSIPSFHNNPLTFPTTHKERYKSIFYNFRIYNIHIITIVMTISARNSPQLTHQFSSPSHSMWSGGRTHHGNIEYIAFDGETETTGMCTLVRTNENTGRHD